MAGTAYRWKPEKPDPAISPNAFVCVSCGAAVPSVLRGTAASGLVVADCPGCGLLIDPYYEHDDVHTAICVILLKLSAWRHVIFNARPVVTRRLAVGFLIALIIESIDIAVLGPLHDPSLKYGGRVAGVAALAQPLAVFRVVYLVNNNALITKDAPVILGRLFAWHVVEALLSLAVFLALSTVWCAHISTSRSAAAPRPDARSDGSHSLRRSFQLSSRLHQMLRAFLVIRSVRMVLAVGLIWETPVYFFVLLDVLGVLWYLEGLYAVARCGMARGLLGSLLGHFFVGLVLRAATGWAPIFLWLDAVFR